MHAVSLSGVSKSFGHRLALTDITIDVPDGAFVTLLGPSGSGKSTILRLIAGLEAPTRGTISVHGSDVTALPAHRRPTATVFQRYALFPHMNVAANVAFGLRQQHIAKAEIAARVNEVLTLVSLADRAASMPHELSGGQEQRVALARALATRPRVLLLDEPLAALDAGLRGQMQQELRSLQRATGVTFLAVTHDQEEALSVSDGIVILDAGRIRQIGSPGDVYREPADAFVARFMGAENVLPLTAVDTGALRLGLAPGGTMPPQPHLVIRPEAITIGVESEGSVAARVVASSYKGAFHVLRCELADATSLVVTHRDTLPIGSVVHLTIPPGAVRLVPGV
jgi:ABC-type Fe3+/spermidine/putrescine transport system ATPase subunit